MGRFNLETQMPFYMFLHYGSACSSEVSPHQLETITIYKQDGSARNSLQKENMKRLRFIRPNTNTSNTNQLLYYY